MYKGALKVMLFKVSVCYIQIIDTIRSEQQRGLYHTFLMNVELGPYPGAFRSLRIMMIYQCQL